MRRFSRIFAWTTLFFVAGAVLFFTKAAALPYKVAWPVLLLSLATFLSRRRELLPFGFAFLFSAAGVKIGNRFGAKYKAKAELTGGIILIMMGLLIVLDHTGIL